MAKKNSNASKTASPFLVVAKITAANLVDFVYQLPKNEMPEEEFYAYMANNFYFNGKFHGDKYRSNYHQFPRQLALYYIDEDTNSYIPRFTHNITEEEAEQYLRIWIKLYCLPNPTSSVKLDRNVYLIEELVKFIENNPSVRNLYEVLEAILQQKITRNDKKIFADVITNYSEVIVVDNSLNVTLTDNYKKKMEEISQLINSTKDYFHHFDITIEKKEYLQRIYYGAPGTGKSNEVKELAGKGKDGVKFDKDCTFRTTFHPDSDYASFVGAYKPYWDKIQEKIVYGFRPQSFLKAYIKAWKNPNKNVALVVEEINRGNCAQIFGDIFQLLDREKNGLSKYPIECDVEMKELLAEEFLKESKEYGAAITDDVYADSKDNINNYYSAHYEEAFEKIKNGEILALPMNLSILATMNTSDQSLFPMDSAFKRRWEWIYEPIVEGKKKVKNTDGNDIEVPLGWKIELGKHKLSADGEEKECVVDWWKFLQKINAVIYSLTSSEDKQLGYFFCQPDKEDGVTISKNLFVGKVVFYLWNEIFKDYAFEHDVCKKESKSEILYFADFYQGKNIIKQTSLVTFFSHLDENQPKIDGKEVNLIEEKTTDFPTIDTPTDGANDGEEPAEEVRSEQTEETATENTEA